MSSNQSAESDPDASTAVPGVDGGEGEPEPPERMPAEVAAQIEELPPEYRPKVREMFLHFSSGPLPPASELAEYDRVVPGVANRIISMAERNSEHRRLIEHKIVDAEIADKTAERLERKRGQNYGLTIGIVTIVCGSIVAGLGHPIVGTFIGTSGVVGLVSVFVLGRRWEQPDPDDTE